MILNPNQNRIHAFYDKSVICVQALDTIIKLQEINGLVSLTLDKLPDIRVDLRFDDHRKEWNILQIVNFLRKWIKKNPDNTINPEKQGYQFIKLVSVRK